MEGAIFLSHGPRISSHPIPWDIRLFKSVPWDRPIPFGALV